MTNEGNTNDAESKLAKVYCTDENDEQESSE